MEAVVLRGSPEELAKFSLLRVALVETPTTVEASVIVDEPVTESPAPASPATSKAAPQTKIRKPRAKRRGRPRANSGKPWAKDHDNHLRRNGWKGKKALAKELQREESAIQSRAQVLGVSLRKMKHTQLPEGKAPSRRPHYTKSELKALERLQFAPAAAIERAIQQGEFLPSRTVQGIELKLFKLYGRFAETRKGRDLVRMEKKKRGDNA